MTTGATIILILFALTAAFVQRVSGFGFGIMMMTVLPHLTATYPEATALSGLLAIVTAFFTAVRMYRHLKWRKLLPILITFLVVSFFFIRVVGRVDSHSFRKVLGGILILVSIYFFFVSGRIHLKPTPGIQVGMGALSGVMGGLFAMQGPPAVIYFIGSADSKEEYIAATQWYFLIGNAMMSLFRASNGYVTPAVLHAWCWAVPAVLAGLWLGSKVYQRIQFPHLRKIVYGYMAVAGVVALLG